MAIRIWVGQGLHILGPEIRNREDEDHHFMVPMKKTVAQTDLVQAMTLIAGLRVKVDEPLARYTSIKIGGPADYFLEVESSAALVRLLPLLKQHDIAFYLLGKGSNVLVSDRGVRGAVIRLGAEFKRIEWQPESARAKVGAAFSVTQLVREAARRGYGGVEFAEGIPGSVGGALVMNAGAYGSEIEKIVERVDGVTEEGKPIYFIRDKLFFSYRDSHLPRGTVVTHVQICLVRGESERVSAKVRELVSRRKSSQPSGYPNSGSMFRNPPGDFSGRLIEAAGLKGKVIGRAQISGRHANFIVNLGGGKAEEVRQLMELAQTEVKKQFGVELEPEVRWLGER